MAQLRTHYDNLQVSRTASAEVIKAAYRTLSTKYHPDRNAGDAKFAKIMGIINASYAVLSDPVQRQRHDAWIAATEAPRNGYTYTHSDASMHADTNAFQTRAEPSSGDHKAGAETARKPGAATKDAMRTDHSARIVGPGGGGRFRRTNRLRQYSYPTARSSSRWAGHGRERSLSLS